MLVLVELTSNLLLPLSGIQGNLVILMVFSTSVGYDDLSSFPQRTDRDDIMSYSFVRLLKLY
eukprot:m.58360 g.58360  ORF g.58360 m.58360 type:complete len:62 (+) comp13759_c0_seq1:988-1173(+)